MSKEDLTTTISCEEEGTIIKRIYLFGSRLYGTNSPNSSDYDFIIILNKQLDKIPNVFISSDRTTLELDINLNNKDIHLDIVFLDLQYFVTKVFLQRHNYKSLLPIYLNNLNKIKPIWYETKFMFHIRTFWLKYLNVRLRQVHRSLLLWCRITAKRSFIENDIRRCRKNLLHAIRYLKYALQITNLGEIYNYQNVKKYFNKFFIETEKFTTWKEYDELFKPIHTKLRKELNEVGFKLFKDSEIITNNYLNEGKYPTVIHYILNYGIRELVRNFSINVSPVSEKEEEVNEIENKIIKTVVDEKNTAVEIVKIINNSEDTVSDGINSSVLLSVNQLSEKERNEMLLSFGVSNELIKIQTNREVRKKLEVLPPVRECWNGMIVQINFNQCQNFKEGQDIKLIALPYEYIFQYDENCAEDLLQTNNNNEIKKLMITKKYLGISILMFYFKGKWRITTNDQENDWNILLSRGNENNLFWNLFKKLNYKLPNDIDKCFMFTMTNNQKIILHGVRNMNTLKEEEINYYALKYNWEKAEILEIIDRNPFILEALKEKKKNKNNNNCNTSSTSNNEFRKRPNSLSVNIPLRELFEKYIDIANDFTKTDPNLFNGFIIRNEEFKRVKIESSIFNQISKLELFIDSETQEESVESEYNEMIVIEMFRNLTFLKKEPIQLLFEDNYLSNYSNENYLDINIVLKYNPKFVEFYKELRKIWIISCHVLNIKFKEMINELNNLNNQSINSLDQEFVKIVSKKSPLGRTFPFFYLRKEKLNDAFEIFTRKHYIHTEATHGFLMECKKKKDQLLEILKNEFLTMTQ
ncbi:hypothetical protein ABK040_007007 [Willaertia magna]